MSLYRKLSRKPKQFLAVTGMNFHQFQTLLPQFVKAYDKFERRRKRKVIGSGKKRQRHIGGGAQFANDVPDRLLMLLLYYRLYLTQEFMTLLFKAEDKSLICRSIQLMRPVFESVLPVPEQARQRILLLADKEQQRRKKRIGTVEEFQKAYPELTFIIDGVEQEKRKPKNKEKRKSDYSKKKSRHTRKQIVMSAPSGIIVSQSKSVGGRSHDFKVFKEDQSIQAVCQAFGQHRVSLYADSGFQGIEDLTLPCGARGNDSQSQCHQLDAQRQSQWRQQCVGDGESGGCDDHEQRQWRDGSGGRLVRQ